MKRIQRLHRQPCRYALPQAGAKGGGQAALPQGAACLIDLHLHLDGSLSPASARGLAALSGVALPDSQEDLQELLHCPPNCQDLNDYLTRFELPARLLQTGEALEQAAFTLCRELLADGVIYAEIRFAPQKHCQQGLTQEQAVQAVCQGLWRSGMQAQAILCCMRGEEQDQTQNLETVRLTKKYLGGGVCACDLAGAEALYPNEGYAPVFARARALGVPFTIHAGEAAGPESVYSALEMGAQRIGHGVHAAQDPVLVELLARRGIPLEICPTSNLDTHVVEQLEQLPIPQLLEQGVTVTINSDNMAVSNTGVRRELQQVAETFGLGRAQIRELLCNAARAAFAPPQVKAALLERIERELACA